ncbi:MAG TPA: hypothetical protein VHR66_14780 [Gemmataceae bacterium]|jgi:hypothetical protein|nr:hypothetical protein [Gemmataceae bacterium]
MKINWLEASDTFRGVHEEGQSYALRSVFLRLGTNRFGPPSPTLGPLLESCEDIELLHKLFDRISDAETWEEVATIEWRPTEFEGTVHGSMIELDHEKALPKGTRVRVSVATLADPTSLNGTTRNAQSRRSRLSE